MFVMESYAAIWRFILVERHSRRETTRVFGLSRDGFDDVPLFTASGVSADKAGIAETGRP